jgi:hypothetical protein
MVECAALSTLCPTKGKMGLISYFIVQIYLGLHNWYSFCVCVWIAGTANFFMLLATG